MGKWETEVEGHQLTIEFKKDGAFKGKLADEKKGLASERSLQLPLLTFSKRWGLNGRDLELDGTGG
ncbi:MAG: hypothetical protein ACYSWU_23400, partial [Planctomycetota bacterium]